MRTIFINIVFIVSICISNYPQSAIFRSPSEYVKGFICNDSIPFYSINHKSFRIYFKDESYTSKNLDKVKAELDLAYSRILSILNIETYELGIYLVAVDSKEEMKDLMGYKIKGGAAKGHDLVFFVYNESIRPQFKHEIFHLIAYETWGLTNHRLLDEGAATYTDNFCFYDNPMYSINAHYLKHNKLFSIDSLINDFDNQARKNDVIAYIQSAGIFKFLYEKYGVEKIKQLWIDGFEDFQTIYCISIKQFEKEWLEFIKSIPIPNNFDINKLNEGCG